MMQLIRGGTVERGTYLVTEHRAIVEGLEARDAAAARAAIARHVETGRRIALDAVEARRRLALARLPRARAPPDIGSPPWRSRPTDV